MKLQLIRHATLFIHYGGKKLLVDPMLSPAGAMPAVPNTENTLTNPRVNLQVNVAELLAADMVLLTHRHRDHFDAVAAALLPKDIPFFCQPEDAEAIREKGFAQVKPLDAFAEWEGIRLTRTRGQHGTGDIGQAMGPVSGFALEAQGEPALYIAGDTIWCDEVAEALRIHRPGVAVVFAGAAEFLQGGPITMTPEHIARVCAASPGTQVVVAHMEAWNHCLLTREALQAELGARGLQQRVRVPADGEAIRFEAGEPGKPSRA